jgi:hypothetical protein
VKQSAMEDTKHIRFKLIEFLTQTICKNNDDDYNDKTIIQDLLDMVRNGTYFPKSTLEINMLTHLASSRLPAFSTMQSPYLQNILDPLWLQNISASFLWLLCSKSFEHAKNVSNILQYNPTGYMGSHVLNTHFFLAEESATKSEQLICLIVKQLFNTKINEIDHNFILEPGANASNLLNFINSVAPSPIFPDFKFLLPIYETFYFSNHDPSFWGGLVWTFLHLMAESFSLNPNPDMFLKWCNFLIQDISLCLPCHQCFLHWQQIIEKKGTIIIESTPQTLPIAMHNLHNEISRALGNPILSFQEYRASLQHKFKFVLTTKLNPEVLMS